MKKSSALLTSAAIVGSLFQGMPVLAQATPPPPPQCGVATTATSLAGDKDGFGIGHPIGTNVADYNAFIPGFNDPAMMDRPLVASSWALLASQNSFLTSPYASKPSPFSLILPLPSGAVVQSAVMRVASSDIDDGEASHIAPGGIDDRLFIDGQEVPGAFDSTDQYIPGAPGAAGRSGVTFIPVSPQLVQNAFADGTAQILIDEPTRLGSFITRAGSSETFAIDYAELQVTFVTPCAPPPAPVYQCSDGLDNDGDGKVDGFDPGCTSTVDNDEFNAAPQLPQCSDGLDNDGDGKVDGFDPGCTSSQDNDETNPVQSFPQCRDGLDNDGDGKVDGFDPGCTSFDDNDETNVTTPVGRCRWTRQGTRWVRSC